MLSTRPEDREELVSRLLEVQATCNCLVELGGDIELLADCLSLNRFDAGDTILQARNSKLAAGPRESGLFGMDGKRANAYRPK